MYMPYSATLFHTWEMEITSEAAAEVLKEILRFLQSHQEHYGVTIKKNQLKKNHGIRLFSSNTLNTSSLELIKSLRFPFQTPTLYLKDLISHYLLLYHFKMSITEICKETAVEKYMGFFFFYVLLSLSEKTGKTLSFDTFLSVLE